jgi:DNA uptake protein ComE-like DNA-binding protein
MAPGPCLKSEHAQLTSPPAWSARGTKEERMSHVIALLIAVVFALGLAGTPAAVAQAPKDKPASAEAKPAPKKEPIDINTASAEELQSLKGIGDVYAKKIIDNRPYKGKDELVSKNVIPQATYNKIKGQIIAKQPAGKK